MVQQSYKESAGYEIVLEYLYIYTIYLKKIGLFKEGIPSDLVAQAVDAFIEVSQDRIPMVSKEVKDYLN